MRLTLHTDYALRVLIYLTAQEDGRGSISAIADAYGISRNHLMKVVHELGRGGFINTVRGRGGGFTLARPAEEMSVGEVVRFTETDLKLLDCENCVIRDGCGFVDVLGDAIRAFLAVLDRHTIADAARDKTWMRRAWLTAANTHQPLSA
jgi:Rrf2 family nitric oxide-sensitive transcriptional repressor